MSHHVSALCSACGSRILALHAMFQRSHGGQRGVAEENRGKSVWSLELINQLGQALPSPHLHSSLCSLEKPSASAISITPDKINSTASDTLLACGHTQKGNLIYINAKKQNTCFSVCVFKAQSVGPRDKRNEIVEFICVECNDMFWTETWMRSHGDEAKSAELTPPGYSLRSFPCATRGGGLAVILRDNFPVTITTSFPFAHSSFELIKVTPTAPDHVHFSVCTIHLQAKRNKLTDPVSDRISWLLWVLQSPPR